MTAKQLLFAQDARAELLKGVNVLANAVRETLEAEGATVGEVVQALSTRYGERFEGIARMGSVVVDGERADPATPLTEGQEVALLPPVSGGYRRPARP